MSYGSVPKGAEALVDTARRQPRGLFARLIASAMILKLKVSTEKLIRIADVYYIADCRAR